MELMRIGLLMKSLGKRDVSLVPGPGCTDTDREDDFVGRAWPNSMPSRK